MCPDVLPFSCDRLLDKKSTICYQIDKHLDVNLHPLLLALFLNIDYLWLGSKSTLKTEKNLTDQVVGFQEPYRGVAAYCIYNMILLQMTEIFFFYVVFVK